MQFTRISILTLWLCLFFSPAPTAAASADSSLPVRNGALTRAERISAQTEIERVYYNHRSWPAENQAPKPPFEQGVPLALIEKKAMEPMRMSSALKQFWNVDITPAMLQAEMDRMERDSKDRATLHELFAALHHDPRVIAETLARGNIAGQLIRRHYAFDVNLHAVARRRAEVIAMQVSQDAKWSGLDAGYSRRRFQRDDESLAAQGRAPGREPAEVTRLSAKALAALRARLSDGEPGALHEDENGWQLERMISGDEGGMDVEFLAIPKRSFDEWWAEAAPIASPEAIYAVSAVDDFRLPAPGLFPAAGCDSWSATSIGANVPAVRESHTAVWTGTEMIVWGGFNPALNTGGRYNPATNLWIATSTGLNVPSPRGYHTAVWSGTEMIVWGGFGTASLNSGGRYNPSADTWSATSIGLNAPGARYYHTAVWTGTTMIVWGGYGIADLNTGGRYDPSTDTWLATSTGANVPAARDSHTAVWTGTEMIVWGGFGPSNLNTGGRYNPSTDAWVATSVGANVPAARGYHTAIWTGSVMIIWGGFGNADLNTGGRYNPLTDLWMPTSTGANVPTIRELHTAVWGGNEMIIWGGFGSANVNIAGRYDPVADAWISTSIAANAPVDRYYHTAVWTGSPKTMIVWGGYNGLDLNSGGIYTSGTRAGSVGNTLRVNTSLTLDLNWPATSDTTSYNVKRCVASCTPATIVASTATNSYSETMNGTSYFYAVESVNTCGTTP